MLKSAARIIFYILLPAIIGNGMIAASDAPYARGDGNKSPIARTRVLLASSINFYKTNSNHSGKASERMSGLFCIKEEFRINRSHTMFFSIGAEYFVHGLKFNSYYFTPDSIQIYDGEMKANYSLYVHELDFPLQLKISFRKENNTLMTPYLMFGYHFRTLLFGKVKVKQDGEQLVNQQTDLTFKNPLFSNKCNPFVSLTFGVQKNKPNDTRHCLFAEVSYRQGFSPYLLKEKFTPSSLYITGSHLTIGVGAKF